MYTWSICQLTAITLTAGTQHDLVEALVFTRPGHVDLNIINGRIIVQDGKMLTVDVPVSPYSIAAIALSDNNNHNHYIFQHILLGLCGISPIMCKVQHASHLKHCTCTSESPLWRAW